MKTFEAIIQLGKARLERARMGEDFFQAVPTDVVGDEWRVLSKSMLIVH